MSWKRPENGAVSRFEGTTGENGAGLKTSPMSTVPEPPMITLPWAPTLPRVAAGWPLMKTVDETAEAIGLPHAEASPCRAAGRPSKMTSGEP